MGHWVIIFRDMGSSIEMKYDLEKEKFISKEVWNALWAARNAYPELIPHMSDEDLAAMYIAEHGFPVRGFERSAFNTLEALKKILPDFPDELYEKDWFSQEHAALAVMGAPQTLWEEIPAHLIRGLRENLKWDQLRGLSTVQLNAALSHLNKSEIAPASSSQTYLFPNRRYKHEIPLISILSGAETEHAITEAIDSYNARRKAEVAQQMVALAMGAHVRLGADSPVPEIPTPILACIGSFL